MGVNIRCGIFGVEAPPKERITDNGYRLSDHEGRALSIALCQPVDGWDDEEAGAECRDTTEQGEAIPLPQPDRPDSCSTR